MSVAISSTRATRSGMGSGGGVDIRQNLAGLYTRKAAQRTPIVGLRDYAFESAQRLGRRHFSADRRTVRDKFSYGIDHDAPELDDRKIAGTETVARAIGDRPHRRPHRHVLHRNAADAGKIAELHRLTILQMVIRERAPRR